MLERPRLLIGPWRPDPTGERANGVRLVCDPAAGETLGVVCSLRPDQQPWWRIWTSPHALEFRETDDRALLLTMRPSRLSKGVWLVRDCDNNDLGRLRDAQMLDPWGHPFAERTVDPAGMWTLSELEGRTYATCSSTDEGDLVAFVEPAISNPYLRMLTLASFALLRLRTIS